MSSAHMSVGIIGAGRIGGTVGRLLASAGHAVRFGVRGPFALDAPWQAMANVSVGTLAEAVSFGDAVIFAGPFAAWRAFAQEHHTALAGRVVIDAANPFPERDGAIARNVVDSGSGSAAHVARWLPGVRYARAFNTIVWTDLRDQAGRAAPRLAMPLAGDDAQAIDVTSRLARDSGFDPVLVGSIDDARVLDPGSAIYARSMTAVEVRATLGLA